MDAVGTLSSPLEAHGRLTLASRTGSGEVLRRIYGFPGSESGLISTG